MFYSRPASMNLNRIMIPWEYLYSSMLDSDKKKVSKSKSKYLCYKQDYSHLFSHYYKINSFWVIQNASASHWGQSDIAFFSIAPLICLEIVSSLMHRCEPEAMYSTGSLFPA